MHFTTVAIGTVVFLYGAYTFYLRVSKPDNLSKLTAMQDRFGRLAGYTLHLIAYSIIPLVFGVVMIIAGSNGRTVF